MRTARSIALLGSAAAIFAVAVHAQPPVKPHEGMLVDQSGMTVYTYAKDDRNSGKSVCNDACAKNWPPVMASSDAKPEGDYTLIQRDDGSQQWAYKGMPLYTFIKDKSPGDQSGDNVRDVWHIVKP